MSVSSTSTTTNNPANQAASIGYFVDPKKGEINELKLALKNFNVERDNRKKREVIKKVIAYMTLGIDVSRLFTDMIMAIETKDIVIKKMVYFYLCNYAHKEPELAIMCINTLRRDCDNDDPMVRGLALRSLCGLRLESILEYIQLPLQKALGDISPYVRKTGVMGILKIYYLSPSLIDTNGYIPQLYRMLQDVDSQVVTNAIYVLNEICLSTGGIEITQATVLHLLNRISEFSEWGLTNILDLISRYKPTSEDETFSIMNLLDPILRTASSAAVLSVLKCFFHLTISLEPTLAQNLQGQIIERSKPPLLTLVTGSNYEIQYTILKHLIVLLSFSPKLSTYISTYLSDYRYFYTRYNEPLYIKCLKIKILAKIVSLSNCNDIIRELNEYITDVEVEVIKLSIESLTYIGIKLANDPQIDIANSGNIVIDIIKNFQRLVIEYDMSYVRYEAMIGIVNIIRSINPSIYLYTEIKSLIIENLSICIKRINNLSNGISVNDQSIYQSSNLAKASIIFLLGEWGKDIIEAPYILDNYIVSYIKNDENIFNYITINQLLVSSMYLFVIRGPEMIGILSFLLRYILVEQAVGSNGITQDINDKALLYYRLLLASYKTNQLDKLITIFPSTYQSHSLPIVKPYGKFLEIVDKGVNSQLISQLFSEFNTLAVVYDTPSKKFIKEGFRFTYELDVFTDLDTPTIVSTSVASTTTNHNQAYSYESSNGTNGTTTVNSNNLLDFMDDHTQHIAPTATQPIAGFTLTTSTILSPNDYQSLWLALPEAFSGKLAIISQYPKTTGDLEAALKQNHIMTMASGSLPPVNNQPQGLKFFIYGIEITTATNYLAQLQILYQTNEVSLTLKSTNQINIQLFMNALKSSFISFGILE